MKKYEVSISRVHKQSPYNCVGYIPEVIADSDEAVIDLPEVVKAINDAFGKQLIVDIFPIGEGTVLQYEIFKKRA